MVTRLTNQNVFSLHNTQSVPFGFQVLLSLNSRHLKYLAQFWGAVISSALIQFLCKDTRAAGSHKKVAEGHGASENPTHDFLLAQAYPSEERNLKAINNAPPSVLNNKLFI